jgi:hypothetical protein
MSCPHLHFRKIHFDAILISMRKFSKLSISFRNTDMHVASSPFPSPTLWFYDSDKIVFREKYKLIRKILDILRRWIFIPNLTYKFQAQTEADVKTRNEMQCIALQYYYTPLAKYNIFSFVSIWNQFTQVVSPQNISNCTLYIVTLLSWDQLYIENATCTIGLLLLEVLIIVSEKKETVFQFSVFL